MMDDNDLTELAKGLVPFVREYVGEAFSKAAVVPPELAEQVASAVRLLHESPPITQHTQAAPLPPRVARLERDDDGNLVPIYEPQP